MSVPLQKFATTFFTRYDPLEIFEQIGPSPDTDDKHFNELWKTARAALYDLREHLDLHDIDTTVRYPDDEFTGALCTTVPDDEDDEDSWDDDDAGDSFDADCAPEPDELAATTDDDS